MKAVIAATGPKAILATDHLTPCLRTDSLFVRPAAVALSPTDWKHLYASPVSPKSILGCDFAGTILAVGSAVTGSWQVGDRVASVVHGGNPASAEDGAFAEFVVAKGDLCMRVPEGMRWEEVVTMPLGVGTVGQSL